jgi:GTPase SAR1 family protein
MQESGSFGELVIFSKLVQVYLAAQILKIVVTIFLGSISKLDSSNFVTFKKKAEETSNKFKNIFIYYFYFMMVFELTIGMVYLYTILNIVVLAYSLFSLLKESSHWENELANYAEKKFAGVVVEKYFRLLKPMPRRLRSLLLLLFILVFLVFDFFISLSENFEISKKISANLFKKQIEKVEAEDGADIKIPQEYKDHFAPMSIEGQEEYVENGHKLEERIQGEIIEWCDSFSDEHSVVIFGDKGIGKTTLLKRIAFEIEQEKDVETIYLKVPPKVISKEDLYEFFHKSLAGDCDEFNLYKYDKGLEKKTIILLDESQNIFLSHTGGFNAYYELTNLINLNTENIFWILSFNKYSWLYLDRAFGRTQFFRNVFEVKGWSDNKIKELIFKRHYKSDYKLSYDLLINATRSQDEIDKYSSIESKFFKLLWEMSAGNPRAALFLWISALSRKSNRYFNVNIPKEIDLDGLEHQPDDLMFVVAHVLKHENLSSKEIVETTNLPEGIVRNSIRLAIEKKYFFRDERKRYMVDIATQYGLTRYLKVKNFIYGS